MKTPPTTRPPLQPFTEPWAAAFCDAINSSDAYHASAQNWIWPLALVLEADAALGYPRGAAIRLELEKGHCRGVSLHAMDEVSAPFVLRGDYASWKQVLKGELDPVMAITRKRLTLEGSLATIMLNARSAKILVTCAAAIPTSFPDEMTA